MKNIKGIKSFKVLGLAMLFSLGVGCSQQQVDSNVDKLVNEAIGDMTKYDITYGKLPDNSREGYTLTLEDNTIVKDNKENSSKYTCIQIVAQQISNNTGKDVQVNNNNGIVTYTSAFTLDKGYMKDASKYQSDINMYLIEKDLFSKGYNVLNSASEDNMSVCLTVPQVNGSMDTNTINDIVKEIYKTIKNYSVDLLVLEPITHTEINYTPEMVNNATPKNDPKTAISQPKKSSSKESIDVKGIEQYLQTGLEDALQSSNFKMDTIAEKDYLAITVTLQDHAYAEYEDFDLNKIGANMADEGLRDMVAYAYDEYVKSDKASFFFTLEDNTGRVIYKTNF